MKRALIICLFCAINTPVFANATPYFPPLQPLNGTDGLSGLTADNSSNVTSLADPFVKQTSVPESNVSYTQVNQIERSLYGHIYANQDIAVRLARIEQSMFSTTYPNLSLSQRVDNIVSNFNQINQYPNITKKDLSKMEAKIFNQNYNQDDTQNRIERLEEQIFGATQSGDITSRYETLRTAINNYKSNQNATNYYQNPLSTTQGGWKGAVGSLGRMLLGGYGGGYMTGFTPQIDPFYDSQYGMNSGYNTGYNNYNNGLNNGYNNFAGMSNPGYGMYNGNRSNHGYSDTFRNYGSGSRVTILN